MYQDGLEIAEVEEMKYDGLTSDLMMNHWK